MAAKVIVLSDIHYITDGSVEISNRHGEFGDILLLRAVHRINRYLKPDLVILGGDLSDNGSTVPLERLKTIADLFAMPVLTLPGNHDCGYNDFFSVFPENSDFLDIEGCRFIPFYDEQMPGYNARRSSRDLERMRALAADFCGPVISCQHVPLHQPGSVNCPYNYTNNDELISVMKESGVDIAVSGHYHAGFFGANQPFGTSVCVPALCEAPFAFWELNIAEDANVSHTEHRLALPEGLNLLDTHVHSHFAHCSENMDFDKALTLANLFNLDALSFSEHSGHLYYTRDEYCSSTAFKADLSAASPHNNRFKSFIQEVTPFRSSTVLAGVEIDCDFKGRPMVREQDLTLVDLRLGAVHALPHAAASSLQEAATCFKTMMASFARFPMDVIAHPFRAFRRGNLETPRELFPFMVTLLKENHLAAELNFHTNEPSEEFFAMCLEAGVVIALGSDSHNLYEVGEFYPHLECLKRIGADLSALFRFDSGSGFAGSEYG